MGWWLVLGRAPCQGGRDFSCLERKESGIPAPAAPRAWGRSVGWGSWQEPFSAQVSRLPRQIVKGENGPTHAGLSPAGLGPVGSAGCRGLGVCAACGSWSEAPGPAVPTAPGPGTLVPGAQAGGCSWAGSGLCPGVPAGSPGGARAWRGQCGTSGLHVLPNQHGHPRPPPLHVVGATSVTMGCQT